MKTIALSVLLAFFLISCDSSFSSMSSEDMLLESAENLNPASATPPSMPGALFERTWVGNYQWELVKPRPPGLGTPSDNAIQIYQIAPVFEDDPLSPPIDVPGFISLGGRDHVIKPQNVQRNRFRAIANTVPVLYPGWAPVPPFGAEQCAIPDIGDLSDQIFWRWVEVSVHPCGQVPMVYAVDMDNNGCHQPLTTVERVEAAVVGGFAEFDFPPEEPWPFAIRPLTEPGQGKQSIAAPDCM
jgi:hypothetical protein